MPVSCGAAAGRWPGASTSSSSAPASPGSGRRGGSPWRGGASSCSRPRRWARRPGRKRRHLNNGLAHSFAGAPRRSSAASGRWRCTAPSTTASRRSSGSSREEGIPATSAARASSSSPRSRRIVAGPRRELRGDPGAAADPEVRMLARRAEGRGRLRRLPWAMLSPKSAMMHMGRFVVGLAEAAVRRGRGGARAGRRHRVRREGDGLAGRDGPEGRSRRATCWSRAGDDAGGAAVLPAADRAGRELSRRHPGADRGGGRGRDAGRPDLRHPLNIGNYFRPSPDRRLIFGGRARFTARTTSGRTRRAARCRARRWRGSSRSSAASTSTTAGAGSST